MILHICNYKNLISFLEVIRHLWLVMGCKPVRALSAQLSQQLNVTDDQRQPR